MVRDVLTGRASEEASAESPAPEPQSIDLSAVSGYEFYLVKSERK